MTALETYLDFLESSSSCTSGKENHCTPRIDAVLHQYREKKTHKDTLEHQKDEKGVGPDKIPLAEKISGPSYESRLMQLEEQLTALLAKSSAKVEASQKSEMTTSPPRKGSGSDSDVSLSTSPAPKPRPLASSNRGEQPGGRRQHRVPKRRIVGSKSVSSTFEDRKRKDELLKATKRPDKNHSPSVQVLTKELDGERERRWKAEQAAARLVEHVQTLQTRMEEEGKRHEVAVVRTSQLEKELVGEQETKRMLQKQILQLQDVASDNQREKEELRKRDKQQIKLLHELEENFRHLETESMKERTVLQSRVKESETLAAGHERELQLLRRSLEQSKRQTQQLQELLAKREEEHQKDLERCRPLESRELQDMIAKQVQGEREKSDTLIKQLHDKLSEQEKAYRSLEDEFRTGLRIEAGRYNELERAYVEVGSEVEATRHTAVAAVQKEKRALAMMEELTGMVREQKAKIRELTSSKEEMVYTLKKRVVTLEAEVADRNKLEARMFSLQEDKGKLESQVTAQSSVIDGLRAERKLWGQELAHQGASLAQERGRMEAQLDQLTKEGISLREDLQRERDALRVKEKQLEDQARTMHMLKREAAEREAESQASRELLEKELKELQFQLEQEEASSKEIQDQVSALFERKEKLKEEVTSKTEERDLWMKKFNNLNSQWGGKVKIIDALEKNLQQVQESFREKESRLLREKDEAVQASMEREEHLKACDDAFREQLEAKEKAHHDSLARLTADKDKEIESLNHKVVSVEGEMRELLEELAKEKRSMETKVTQLTTVLQDLQKDFTDNRT